MFIGSGETVDGAIALAEVPESFGVDAVFIVEAAADFTDADDFVSRLGHEARGVGTDVAKTLDDDARGLAVESELFNGLLADDKDAASGGFAATAGAANVDGLAGDDGGHGLAHVHGVGVHDPRHGLFVGIDVGGGDVFFGADEFK